MIVYRNYNSVVSTEEKIESIEHVIKTLESMSSDKYDHAVNLLIECGELETGITDTYCKEKDIINNQVQICREITINSAMIIQSLWTNNFSLKDKLFEIKNKLKELQSSKIPRRVRLGVPEGFVFYGLYPEIYMESASKFFEDSKPDKVIVIGLRSIGTQLSAVVTAQLLSYGCKVESFTVRPKGHPFDRHIQLDDQLKNVILSSRGSFIAIVDEGPGLSGSSFGGTLKEIRNLGFPIDKTVIFPSWFPQSDTFISNNARDLWNQYKKYIGSFENQWIFSEKLEKRIDKKIIYDISAGMWREHVYKSESDFPPVHPHHERRKYLLVSNYYRKSSHWIAKFVGLGKYGLQNIQRADLLSDNGFSPPVHNLSSGFAIMEYVNGIPLNFNDVDVTLMEFLKRYLSFINENMSATLQVTYDSMIEMIYYNIENGLGREWCHYLEKMKNNYKSLYEENVVSIDGHMMPQDFIRTEKGIIKVDHIEHHADQFFHGCQNIAWDISGIIVEFHLDKKKRSEFIERIINIDPFLSRKISFFIIAYLAYRLGYAKIAAESLGNQKDALRFNITMKFYSELLQSELQQL